MFVYVLNKNGKPLMPCKEQKAAKLLKRGLAKVVYKTPFTIQLLYGSSGYKQNITLGVDAGSKYIGFSATNKTNVLLEGEVILRDNIKQLLVTRRENRRFRRHRKTRYRKPRFLNRTRKKKWLAPSVDNKVQSHIQIVDFVHKLLPISNIIVEVAQFDTQKLKNPEIKKEEYSQGDQLHFWNVREYVLFRDHHKCQLCKGKSKDAILNIHHIESRKTGSDAPNNLITLCKSCHQKVHQDALKIQAPENVRCKEASQITTMRWFVYHALKERYLDVKLTHGYVTKNTRIRNGLEKSHKTDARCISGNPKARPGEYYIIKKMRRNNRKLHKNTIYKGGIRKKHKASRYVNGFQIFDKVCFDKTDCFIYGRRSSGYFKIATIDGVAIHNSVNYKKLKLLEKAKTFLIIQKRSDLSSPCLKAGVSRSSI